MEFNRPNTAPSAETGQWWQSIMRDVALLPSVAASVKSTHLLPRQD